MKKDIKINKEDVIASLKSQIKVELTNFVLSTIVVILIIPRFWPEFHLITMIVLWLLLNINSLISFFLFRKYKSLNLLFFRFVLIDVVILTIILYYTGELKSILIYIYMMPVMLASAYLSLNRVVFISLVSAFAFLSLSFLEMFHIITPILTPGFAVPSLMFWVLTCIGLILIVAMARVIGRATSNEREKTYQYEYLTNQLETILDHIPGLVFYKDTKNNFIRVNKYVAEAHRLPKNELEGKNLMNLYSKEDAEKYHKDDLEVINTGIAKLNIIEPWETPSGLTWVNTSKIPVINEAGKIIGIIGISFDITELKKAEFLKQKNREMEIMNKYLIKIREDERLKISREIHDELGQTMTILKMDLSWIRENIDDKVQSIHKINNLIEISRYTLKNIQRISSDLRPRMLDDLGLVSAIEWYCGEFEERTGVKCILSLEDIIFTDTQKNITFFRILQESLTNVARHANASFVNIQLKKSDKIIIMIIDDDGIGIPLEKIESENSTGLMGMRERAGQYGGSVEIVRKEDFGTKIIIFIPE